MDINDFNADQAKSLVKNYIDNTPERILNEILTKIEVKASEGHENISLHKTDFILNTLNVIQLRNLESILKFRGFIVS